ncbi:MAG: hypothetical protein ABFQ65_02580 [Nanoarchaeota archaeon]
MLNKLDLLGLFFNLNIILICWILIIKTSYTIKRSYIQKSYNQTLGNNLLIGFGAGLIIFVLSWFADNFTLSPISFNSPFLFVYSILAGLVNLVFQISIVLVLIDFILIITLTSLRKN